jgi:hypothetical protein
VADFNYDEGDIEERGFVGDYVVRDNFEMPISARSPGPNFDLREMRSLD